MQLYKHPDRTTPDCEDETTIVRDLDLHVDEAARVELLLFETEQLESETTAAGTWFTVRTWDLDADDWITMAKFTDLDEARRVFDRAREVERWDPADVDDQARCRSCGCMNPPGSFCGGCGANL